MTAWSCSPSRRRTCADDQLAPVEPALARRRSAPALPTRRAPRRRRRISDLHGPRIGGRRRDALAARGEERREYWARWGRSVGAVRVARAAGAGPKHESGCNAAFRSERSDDWTAERIAQLSIQDIKQLRENAERLNESGVAALCSEALAKRRERTWAARKAGSTTKPRHLVPRTRAFEARGVWIQDARTSWGGVRKSDGAVVIALWADAIESASGGCRSALGAQRRRIAPLVRPAGRYRAAGAPANARSSSAAPKACLSTASGSSTASRKTARARSMAPIRKRSSCSRSSGAATNSGRAGARRPPRPLAAEPAPAGDQHFSDFPSGPPAERGIAWRKKK